MSSVTVLSRSEQEARTEQRRLIIASIVAGLVLCFAIWLLLWLLFHSRARGAGIGESSRKGQGLVGQGAGQGPDIQSAPSPDPGTDQDAGDPEHQGQGKPDSQANSTQPPVPPTDIGETPPEDSAPVAGAQPGKSRFSLGGSDFFGVSAEGNSFIYVVDCSGSMAGERIVKAKAELMRSINSLEEDKSIYVIFFSHSHYSMFYPDPSQTQLVKATSDNRDRIRAWVNGFQESGGTVPDSAIQLALQMRPDAIFLLTDGAFDNSAVDVARRFNTAKIPINTIGFQDLSGGPNLKQIASDSGGKYKYVP